MKPFTKPATTIAEQLALLKACGLTIRDEARAAHFLEAVSHRLLSTIESAQQKALLLNEYPEIRKQAMGLPDNWQADAFWHE